MILASVRPQSNVERFADWYVRFKSSERFYESGGVEGHARPATSGATVEVARRLPRSAAEGPHSRCRALPTLTPTPGGPPSPSHPLGGSLGSFQLLRNRNDHSL